ncbi:MAG: hypothetical protein ACRD2L_08615, partial [Terriglobia bacterium]
MTRCARANTTEADLATARRQQNVATTMHGQRVVIDSLSLKPLAGFRGVARAGRLLAAGTCVG